MLKKSKTLKILTFVIIDDNYENGLKTKAVAESFQNLSCLAYSDNYDEGLDAILEYNPDIVFLEVDPESKDSNLSLNLINELYRYLNKIPKIFVTAKDNSYCLSAFKHGVSNYFISPIQQKDLRKSIIIIEKELETIPKISVPVDHTVFSTVKSIEVNQPKEVVYAENIQKTSAPIVDVTPVTFSKTIEENNPQTFVEEEVTVHEEIEFDDKSLFENPNEEVLLEEEIVVAEEELSETNVAVEPTFTPEDDIFDATINTFTESVSLPENKAKEEKEVRFKQLENTLDKPLIICVKSYGDYRYIEAKDVCYLQADNNSTDIHINTGEMITAFKTLKHFENALNYPFVRIHNSYIVNTDYVSRIHTGNAVCHIKNTTTKLPFSKSYKENVDAIIGEIAAGNYLEI